MEKKPAGKAKTDTLVVEGPEAIDSLIRMVDVLVEVAPEAPVVEEPEEATPPATHFVTLDGQKPQKLAGAVNGVIFSLPCGCEIEINDAMYQAVKAHIIHERN